MAKGWWLLIVFVVETIGIFCDGSVIVGVFQHREYILRWKCVLFDF